MKHPTIIRSLTPHKYSKVINYLRRRQKPIFIFITKSYKMFSLSQGGRNSVWMEPFSELVEIYASVSVEISVLEEVSFFYLYPFWLVNMFVWKTFCNSESGS